MALTVILEASPLVADGSATVAVRLAGGGRRPYYGYRGFTDWRSGLMGVPRFSTAIGWEDAGWSGGSLPQVAAMSFATQDRTLAATLAGLLWRGARVAIRTGDDAAGEPAWKVELTGTVADAKMRGGVLELVMSDLSGDLVARVVPGTFAGTGGLEGVEEATGRVKRRSWGRVFNVEGRILDKANSIYEFGDPAFPLAGFEMLKDRGRAGPMTAIAYQGSAAATFAALQAATAPSGGGVVAPSIACAKWYTTPAGPLTADLRGEATGGGYQEDAGYIALGILAARSTVTLTNRPGVTALRNFPVGLHCADASETVAMALDRLLLPVSLVWSLSPTGTVDVSAFAWDNPVELVMSQEATRETTFLPLLSRKLGFQRNERIHNEGEISAVLLTAGDVTYADGTPIEALKPAQAGATLGARAGVNLVDSGGASLGDSAIKNNVVTIGANGALAGAGGGQVSIGGLGYLGDLNATYGAAWAATLTGRPTNLSNLLGSEGINNLFISVGANGVLVGGGGGQVTISGLGYYGALNATFDGVTDRRANNDPPSYYRTTYPLRVAREFKQLGAIAAPGTGTYGLLETYVDWTDPSGGQVKQRLTTGNGEGFLRVGNADDSAWGAWQKDLSGFNPPRLGGDLLSTGGTVLTDSGAGGVLNFNVSIASNGSLTGAGGGQVTISGLGYSGDLNATFGASWSANLAGRPGNLAGLTGGEGIQNTLISLSASGSLAGGGGGQVTFSGIGGGPVGTLSSVDLGGIYAAGLLPTSRAVSALINANVSIGANGALSGGGGGQVTLSGVGFLGDTDAQRNSRIYVSASALYGIGTGDGTLVANAGLSIGSNGALVGGGGGQVTITGLGFGGDLDAQRNTRITISASVMYGIGTGDGTAVANVGVSIASNGVLVGGGGGQVSLGGLGAGGLATKNQANTPDIVPNAVNTPVYATNSSIRNIPWAQKMSAPVVGLQASIAVATGAPVRIDMDFSVLPITYIPPGQAAATSLFRLVRSQNGGKTDVIGWSGLPVTYFRRIYLDVPAAGSTVTYQFEYATLDDSNRPNNWQVIDEVMFVTEIKR